MELVEGETIAARLKQGPMPIEMVRYYGAQIAAALAEAHAKGNCGIAPAIGRNSLSLLPTTGR